jgi:hypothetical protein
MTKIRPRVSPNQTSISLFPLEVGGRRSFGICALAFGFFIFVQYDHSLYIEGTQYLERPAQRPTWNERTGGALGTMSEDFGPYSTRRSLLRLDDATAANAFARNGARPSLRVRNAFHL